MIPTRGAPLKGEVRIHWDAHKIPFIEAEHDEDAAFALGLVQAHLRLGMIQMGRRVAQGRLSEMIGFPGVDADHMLRTIDFDRAVPEMIETMPDDTRLWLEGFVAGFNFYQENTPDLPHEYDVLGFEPEPFTVEDILTAGRLVSSDQLWSVWLVLMRARERDDWPEILADIKENGFRAVSSFEGMELDDANEILGGYRIGGSNAVAVSGARTESGAALLAGDPHLGFTAPNIWLLAGVKSPSLHVVGVMPTGLPFFALGRNPQIAWTGTSSYGVTSSFLDLSDVPDPGITERTERIDVRFEPGTRSLTIRDSDYGPIVSDLAPIRDLDLPPIALRWIGHRPSDEVGAFLRVAQARDFAEFRDAFRSYAVAGMNFVYADVDGNIGTVQAIRTPQRDKLPGDTLADDIVVTPEWVAPAWQGTYDATTLPAAYNPPSGFLANANNRPSDDPRRIGFLFSSNDRIDRIESLVGGEGRVTPGLLRELQEDVYMASSVRLRDALTVKAYTLGMVRDLSAERKAVYDLIESWNGHYHADSRGALAYEFFLYGYTRRLYAADFRETPLTRLTEVIGMDWKLLPDLERFDREPLVEALLAGLDSAAEALETYENWGDAHRLVLVHPFSAIPGVGDRYRYGDYPVGGSTQTLMKRGHKRDGEDYTALYGAGARILIDLASPDENYFVILGGQDGWLNSANFLDQIPLWLDGSYVRLPLDVGAVRERSVRTTRITR